MRKLLLAGLLCFSGIAMAEDYNQRTGVIWGFGGGLGFNYDFGPNPTNPDQTLGNTVIIVDTKIGYQKYYNDNFGFRAYAHGAFGDDGEESANASLTMLTGNIDALAELPFGSGNNMGIGVLAGLGYGYIGYKDQMAFTQYGTTNVEVGMGPVVNLGVFLTVNYEWKVEVGAKMFPTVKNGSSFDSNMYSIHFSRVF